MTLMKQVTTAAMITVISMQTATATQATAPEGFNPANAVMLEGSHANSFRNFAPELPQTMARMPKLNLETGLAIDEVAPGLFYVTEGVYQSAFLVTGDGVIVFDAPPSFAHKLPAAIASAAPDQAIKYLVYSHGHNDHVGGAAVFADIPGLQIVASVKVAKGIESSGRPGILAPTTLFDEAYEFSLGQHPVELKTAAFHSEHEDIIAYLPKSKFLIAVDTITPGEVPFMNFGATSDIGGYLNMFDTLLAYDFDHIMSGHISILGDRNDLILARDYAFDVRDTALNGMNSFFDRFGTILATMEYENANLGYRMAMEAVRDECATAIIGRWEDKLSVVDVWADSHCETVVLHAIMH